MKSPPTSAHPNPAYRPRWWPAILIIVLVGLRCLYVWAFKDTQRQYKVMGTAIAILIGMALLSLWWCLFSRLRWRVRILGVLSFGVLLVLLASSFRYRGVTGDLVPIFEPRWTTRSRVTIDPGNPGGRDGINARPVGRDFPQFLGPSRDGVISGVRLARDWSTHPPQLLWRQDLGAGWGGTALVEGKALTQEQDGAEELVCCYDANSGRRLWEHRDGARYDSPIGGIGPRATPTVSGRRVYALGATGHLNCLDLESGEVLWSTQVVGQVPVKDLEWGVSSSPLVHSNLVVVAPRGVEGRSLAAYRADNGELAWVGGVSSAHYSSPRLEWPLGQPQILTFTATAAAGHDPGTGSMLWEYGWRTGHPHVTDPRLIGANQILISSGYGTGSRLIELKRTPEGGWTATNLIWRSNRLKSKFANLLVRAGFVYGLDDGRLVCLDLADGSQRWSGERYGHGQLLLVDDLILLTAENGDVVLADASPDAFREWTRFHALDGKTWNPPALAGDLLIVRNDRESAAFRLPVESKGER